MATAPRFEGTLKSWNDGRGFGFVEPAQGGQELFVHARDFPPGGRRPAPGLRLTFEVVTGPDGRKRARAVQLAPARRPSRPARGERPAPWTPARRLVLPAFALVVGAVGWAWGLSVPVLLGYAGLSLVAFAAYAFDKSAAVAGRWRTREQTLHLLALAGGWPGALLAQQALRHKTSKPGFVAVFWATVVLNVAAFVAWHAGLLAALVARPS